jgi:quercetin 2,3-dioxygenase
MTDEKKVRGTYPAGIKHRVGDAFEVQNVFPSNGLSAQIDPYLLLDYVRPMQLEPGTPVRGAGEHAHHGFETVTIVYQGYLQHSDSAGNAGSLGPGDVQWMSAASGITHDERYDPKFAEQGGTLELAQFWVSLPAEHQSSLPRYQNLVKERIPVTTLGQAGYVRVIAGDMSGVDGPAQTHSPLGVFDLFLNGGHDTEFCLCDGHNAVIVLLRGSVIVNGKTPLHGEAATALLEREGSMVTLQAQEDSSLLILSGRPLSQQEPSNDSSQGLTSREAILEAVEKAKRAVST